jgi:hypothetical protein
MQKFAAYYSSLATVSRVKARAEIEADAKIQNRPIPQADLLSQSGMQTISVVPALTEHADFHVSADHDRVATVHIAHIVLVSSSNTGGNHHEKIYSWLTIIKCFFTHRMCEHFHQSYQNS